MTRDSRILPDKETKCHYTFFRKTCFDMVTKCNCRKWSEVTGKHPETNEKVKFYDCADNLLPQLTIESNKRLQTTQKAIEDFKNESIEKASELNRRLEQTFIVQTKMLIAMETISLNNPNYRHTLVSADTTIKQIAPQ